MRFAQRLVSMQQAIRYSPTLNRYTRITSDPMAGDNHPFFSQVLTSAERLLREKNEGDKIQELLREGQKATMELQHQVSPLQ